MNAQLLFEHGFDAVSGDWPLFTFPPAAAINGNGIARPRVDGSGRGMSSPVPGVVWRAKSVGMPGTRSYRASMWAKWKNAGFASQREVGIIALYRDPRNCLVARLRSMGVASPELRLFLVENGNETQLGSTYTGSDISATQLNAGVEWSIVVNETGVRVYVGSQTSVSRGTLRISHDGDFEYLRQNFTVGVELRGTVHDDIRVDNLRVYDLADEYATDIQAGAGWQVALGDDLYTMDDLAAHGIRLTTVTQGYGAQGNTAAFRVDANYVEGILRPGLPVRVFHGGVARFRGWIAQGGQSASPQESQTWRCFDATWNARLITLLRADKIGHYAYNVTDETHEDYDSTLTGKTLGEIIADQIDRHADLLRFYGCAPPTGPIYDAADLAPIDAVISNITCSGQFPAMLETLLRFVGHKYAIWVDPVTQQWRFVDVTTQSIETISCTVDHVQLRVTPDRDKAYTRVEWRGTRHADDERIHLSTRDGTLKPVWSKTQEDSYGKHKRTLTRASGAIINAGDAVAPDGVTRPFFDVSAGLFDEDDFRGALATLGGADAEPRLVHSHTSTRFWLTTPAWSSVPTPGTRYRLSLDAKDSIRLFSAGAVGRAFYVPEHLADRMFFWNEGFCGSVIMLSRNRDGRSFSQQYQYRLHFPTDLQRQLGYHVPMIGLSEMPRPLGPDVSSDRMLGCGPDGRQASGLDIEMEIPVTIQRAAYFVLPADVEGVPQFSGPAYDDWGVQQTYIVDDPDYTDEDQDDGLLKAAAAILAVKSQKQYLAEFTLPVPFWTDTTRFAGLRKRVRLSSGARATGFESAESLHVFGVAWDIESETVSVQAGTAAGWLDFTGIDISRAFYDARIARKTQAVVKDMDDFRRRLQQKSEERVGGQEKGRLDACEVVIANDQTRRVVSVEKDDADKVRNITHGALRTWLDEELSIGAHANHPGAPIAVPGRDGAAAQQAIDGPVLRSYANPDIPFQGPVDAPNGDRGRYGGQITTSADDGRAPREIVRRGGYAFRKAEDARGNPDGGPGIEYAALDVNGAPAGPWLPFDGARSLPGGRAPLSMLTAGSTQYQLLEQSRELARGLGRVVDSVGRILAPGDVTTGVPDGAPADLASLMRVAGLVGSDLRMVPESFGDPGGVVFRGPVGEHGADSETLWRVKAPEMLLLRVLRQHPDGSGTNGGNYGWDLSGPGGTTEYLSRGGIIHKQLHPGEMQPDTAEIGNWGVATSQNPFGFAEGAVLNGAGGGMPAGTGGVIPMPPFARGVIGTWALVSEAAPMVPDAAGSTFAIHLKTSVRASPWTASTPTATQFVPVADGAGQGVGIFEAPAGYVVPGQRTPFALALSLVYSPGAGTAAATSPLVVLGMGVEVAVVEGGYVLLTDDEIEASDEWTHTHPASVDVAEFAESWSFESGKDLTESAGVNESWSLELNPPSETIEDAILSDAVAFDVTKAHAETMEVFEAWDIELNP